MSFDAEVERGERFRFGRNWRRFLRFLDEEKIVAAEAGLASLHPDSLEGRQFLDVGSGSGLMSLAARRLGARVVSFDFDPESVACTEELKRRYFPADRDWTVLRASALDAPFLRSLGDFDVVYSWGVLHHTGRMWEALDLVAERVRPDGLFAIAIYNRQRYFSSYWRAVKRLYNRNVVLRLLMILVHLPSVYLARVVARAWTRRPVERGMSLWYDMLDWLGGYPFEVAQPEEVLRFLRKRGFELVDATTVGGGYGCNEFTFRRRRLGAS
jgi:2-polyprenyl-3-methyl-5-hydroxy-6-metoxy-1,4-benzoquinol methylase